MDGGAVREQEEGDHQVVIFTFSGKISPSDVKQWNNSVASLKKALAPNLVGVTIKGVSSKATKRKVKRRKR